MAALVRTTSNPDSFVLLGGDACHHCGEIRPSPGRLLPTPAPSCITRFLDTHSNNGTQPFFQIQRDVRYAAYCHDADEAEQTIIRLQRFDALDNVLVIFAHDASIKGVVGEFPATLNDWLVKGWGRSCRWRFLQDFAE